jgi:peptide deformylase
MLLKVLHYPDERLRNIAQPVINFNDELKTLVQNMLETMYDLNGIGLAAIQVGVSLRVAVIDLTENNSKPQIFINPILSDFSVETNIYEEGCLSVPDIHEKVIRPKTLTIKAQDINGKEFTMHADELLATCIQHELDHLNGKVFIDRLSKLKKSMIDKKILKRQY